MNKTIATIIITGALVVSLLLVTNVSAWQMQIRPGNQMNHPGIWDPYSPPEEGPNHRGVSDYSSTWNWMSELCEDDNQIRPANQGWNIMQFFDCFCADEEDDWNGDQDNWEDTSDENWNDSNNNWEDTSDMDNQDQEDNSQWDTNEGGEDWNTDDSTDWNNDWEDNSGDSWDSW